MNRHQRRAAKSLREHPRALAERAEREGYALYQATPEHAAKLAALRTRIFTGFDDVSCFDCFSMFLHLSVIMVVYGSENTVDRFPVRNRETFLKNCAEMYDEVHARKVDGDRKKVELQ